MNKLVKPVYLLADSQLLFRQSDDEPFLDSLKNLYEHKNIQAAYIGVSNGDDPVFYEMFEAAMQMVGIENCMHITSAYTVKEERFLSSSDIILLAGGLVQTGWQVLQKSGMHNVIVNQYYNGTALIGISAGAIQLGMMAEAQGTSFNLLQLIPLLVSVHDEENDWSYLNKLMLKHETYATGIGIPLGGGMIYHPDNTIEALAKPLVEVKKIQNELKHTLIMPN